MTDFARLLAALVRAEVELIVIGGFAATAHGSAHVTVDLDVVYRRSPDNLERLVAALADLQPYLRGAPPGLPFRFDVDTLERGLNFTLTTAAGDLDLIGEAAGGGTYEALLPHSESGNRWVAARCRFFLPVRVFSRLFRGKFLHHLRRASGASELVFPGTLEALADPNVFGRLLDALYGQEWVVYSKPPVGGAQGGARVPCPLHPPSGDLQRPAGGLRWRDRDLPLSGLSARRSLAAAAPRIRWPRHCTSNPHEIPKSRLG